MTDAQKICDFNFLIACWARFLFWLETIVAISFKSLDLILQFILYQF